MKILKKTEVIKMTDKNKIEPDIIEIDDEQLDNISGGSLDNVSYTDTTDISDNTKEKIK